MDTVSDAEWSRRTRQALKLDLGGAKSTRRRDPSSDVVLSSPDVRLLKLASPELDRLVLQQFRHHHHHHQHDELQQQDSSEDRQMDVTASEEYARGFVDVLLELHAQRHSDYDPPSVTGTSSVQHSSPVSFQTTRSMSTAGDCDHQVSFCHDVDAGPVATGSDAVVALRETSLKSPHESYAERSRLERKRARNRLAASRCRNRKLERIEHLQNHVDRLRAVNARLSDEVNQLHETVTQLRRDVQSHVSCQPGVSLPPFCF